jgi:hypothetical protein
MKRQSVQNCDRRCPSRMRHNESEQDIDEILIIHLVQSAEGQQFDLHFAHQD